MTESNKPTNNNPTGIGGFKRKEKYTEAYASGELRRAIRKEFADEMYILGTFHAANVFFYANFIHPFLKKHRLTHRTYMLLVYMHLLGKSSPSSPISSFLHPTTIPVLLGKPCSRMYDTLRRLSHRGLVYAHRHNNKKYYQLTDEGRKLVHSFGREYKACITAWELQHGDILWAEINKEFDMYK